jgi:Flp pilus assembly protein TadG
MTPIAVGVVMFVLQIGITYHAKSVVIAAAQDGARAAQTETGTTNDARHVIEMLLGDEGLLETTSVDVSRTDDHVSVQITAEVTSLVPFWNPTVTGAAEGPTERFRSEPER